MNRENLWSRTFFALLQLAFLVPGAARGQSGLPAESREKLDKLAKADKIEIVTADPRFPVMSTYGTIDGKQGDNKESQACIGLFASEFALYPAELVKKSQLKRIVLCSELSFGGQLRSAIPDYEHDALYLDVSRGSYSKTYLRTVVHHEFFHIIDYKDDGSVYKDDRWSALNPPKFTYGNGGAAVQNDPETSVLTDKYPGFLNHYSTTGVEEDKAEVFAHMIVDHDYVMGRVKEDPVLKAKFERMRELLSTFCPEMNDKFWNKVRAVKRAEK
jgi:hypothetical protein